MANSIVEFHTQNIDNALDVAAEDSGLPTSEYRQVLEDARSRIETRLQALKDEGQ